MGLLDRIREWLTSNERGLMTTGAWILAGFCIVVFAYNIVKCYNLLR